ncbi:hypothetical protein BV509_20360 [Rhodovulum sulfidophilum]|nr:hypothetical protein [Rhodovulum visakhapatnamense]MBL3571368.1 hypothetical protein [Rhodovulum visakhapatnamense]OLS46472.1 hypothetical protein BV509_20360 [Rhodovulum sulfidophilum]
MNGQNAEMVKTYAILVGIVIVTAAGDYALKMAAVRPSPLTSFWFVKGTLLYAVTAVGWIALMQSHSLPQIAVLYSAATIVALSFIGAVAFGEHVSLRQWTGIVLALTAVILVEFEAS